MISEGVQSYCVMMITLQVQAKKLFGKKASYPFNTGDVMQKQNAALDCVTEKCDGFSVFYIHTF